MSDTIKHGKCPTCGSAYVSNYGPDINDNIELFTNGQERYNTSPLFNSVVNLLTRGHSAIAIIDDLVLITERVTQSAQIQDYIMGCAAVGIYFEENDVIGILAHWSKHTLTPLLLSKPELTIAKAKLFFSMISDEERIEVMSDYCKYCGRNDISCQCWNDD